MELKIIAEAGVNHNGNISIAKKLINVAKDGGADYIKFQTFKTENVVCKNTPLVEYQRSKTKSNSQYKLLKKLELSEKNFKTIIKYCKKKKIKFLSTPFDLESLDFLIKSGIKTIKIASGEINNFPLLKKISRCAKEIFLSTGMSNIEEIKFAIKILTKFKISKKKIIVLHCTTNYPTQLKDVNMLALKDIAEKLKVNVGYSDHTTGCEAAIAAVALGAVAIEKHITLNKNLSGPDHKSSIEPNEFNDFVKFARNTKKLLGIKKKQPTLSELKHKKLIRRSIVAKIDIKKGAFFTEKNIICKRPEGGISPNLWKKVIGKKSKRNFKADSFISLK